MDVEAACSLINEELKDLLPKVADELLTRVKDRTPVKTGTARDGWEVTDLTTTGFKIKNDVEYIGYLEDGTPKMRPVKMLATTLMEIDDIIAKETK
jgi:hypothetical protein